MTDTPPTAVTTAPDLAPRVGDAPVVKQTERPHPLTPFIRGWLVLLAIGLALFRDFLPGGGGPDQGNDFLGGDWRLLVVAVTGVVLLAGLAGFVSWYFTRFVIDDEELRVETGAVFKSSRKVPFERLQSVDLIQPLAARLFGLAELRLEAGAGDSGIKLRYLSRSKASRFRDYLLARASGEQATMADHQAGPTASLLTDLGAADRPLVVVPLQRLVGGFLLSGEWLVTLIFTVAGLIVSIRFDAVAYALPGLLPLIIGAVSLVGRRVIAMFNFTLAESPRGLRITRGLTNLTSQSVPLNRVQGVRVVQPLLWRRAGWYRLDVDILGYASGTSENNEGQATSVLLPVATSPEVSATLARVLPGVDLAGVRLEPAPRRARWLRWFDFWTLRSGWDAHVVVSEHGWVTRRRDLVPHAKTQSVRIVQGPLQRRLRLANVHVDTTRGPVDLVARHLDTAAARELALAQLDRARTARRREREQPRPSPAPVESPTLGSPGPHVRTHDSAAPGNLADDSGHPDAAVLARFGVDPSALLGQGGESRVYALDPTRVLRVYQSAPPAPLLAQLGALYAGWAGLDLGVELPRILETGTIDGRTFSVDRRMAGQVFSAFLASAPEAERRTALLSYLDAAAALPALPCPVPGFARLVGLGAPQTYATLPELLADQLNRALATSRAALERDLPDVPALWARLFADLAERRCTPTLVHGDLCPANAFVRRRIDGSPYVSGIGDFSPHSLAADPLLDLTGAVALVELETYPDAAADARRLTGVAVERYGAEVGHWIGVYRRYYGFYFSMTYDVEPDVYAWCLHQLRA